MRRASACACCASPRAEAREAACAGYHAADCTSAYRTRPTPSRILPSFLPAIARSLGGGPGEQWAAAPIPTAIAVTSHTVFDLPSDFATRQQSSTATVDHAAIDLPGVSLGCFAGLDAVLVETAHATAAVAVFGGQVLSYVPRGGRDVLWLSPLRAELPTPVRGGVPVCWPFFGRQGQGDHLPSHGFARTLPWRLAEARAAGDGITLVLELPALQGLGLQLRTEVHVGRQLRQALVTRNTGTAPGAFTEALHNYFAVSDVDRVRVEGVAGLTYLDKNDGGRPHLQHGDWTLADPRDPGRSDRTYPGAGGSYRIVDPGLGRAVRLDVQGGRSVVVWNPGEAGAAKMADVGPHWPGFLCVEAANAGPDLVELAPGQEHALVQAVSVEAL